jgi:hypothetical protein
LRFSTLITQHDYNEFKKYFQEVENRKRFQAFNVVLIGKGLFPIMNIFIIGVLFVFWEKIFDNHMTETINPDCIFALLEALSLIGLPVVIINTLMWKLLTGNRNSQYDSGPVIGLHEFIISNGSIIDKINGNIFISKFNNIIKIHETYNNIFIMIDCNMAYIVNKNTIRPSEDRSMIISNIIRLNKNIRV